MNDVYRPYFKNKNTCQVKLHITEEFWTPSCLVSYRGSRSLLNEKIQPHKVINPITNKLFIHHNCSYSTAHKFASLFSTLFLINVSLCFPVTNMTDFCGIWEFTTIHP